MQEAAAAAEVQPAAAAAAAPPPPPVQEGEQQSEDVHAKKMSLLENMDPGGDGGEGEGRRVHARRSSIEFGEHTDRSKYMAGEILAGMYKFTVAVGTFDVQSVRRELRRARRKTFPRLQKLILAAPADIQAYVKDFTFRNFFRVHAMYFLGFTLIVGASITSFDPHISFLDAWFSACAAMTGGSLMPYDISLISRPSEAALWFAMTFGGITLVSVMPAAWRIYLFRKKLRPMIYDIEALRNQMSKAGAELDSDDVRTWLAEESWYEALLEEFTIQDEGLHIMVTIILTYTFAWHIVGGGLIYAGMMYYGPVAEYAERGITDAWFAIFMISSCLNNVGLSLLDDSMLALTDRTGPLLVMGWAIVFGNTAYPIVLRAVLRLLHRLMQSHRGVRFCLDEPQRAHFMLYSDAQTLALVVAVVCSNLFQTVMFMYSSAELPGVRDGRSDTQMWLLAWFQAVNSRSAGLQVFDLKEMAKVMLVIYGFFMWLNPFPIVMAMEREGQYFEGHPIVSQFMKKYVAKHNSWIFIIYMIVAYQEQSNMSLESKFPPSDVPQTTLFNILFELLSAYGTNGLSMGFPGLKYSLCGTMQPLSKLCLIALMMIGRHRSMPNRADPKMVTTIRELGETYDKLSELARLQALVLPDGALDRTTTGDLSPLSIMADIGEDLHLKDIARTLGLTRMGSVLASGAGAVASAINPMQRLFGGGGERSPEKQASSAGEAGGSPGGAAGAEAASGDVTVEMAEQRGKGEDAQGRATNGEADAAGAAADGQAPEHAGNGAADAPAGGAGLSRAAALALEASRPAAAEESE